MHLVVDEPGHLAHEQRWWKLEQTNVSAKSYLEQRTMELERGDTGDTTFRKSSSVKVAMPRGPEALMSVVVDRVLGLFSMVIIGACFVLTSDDRAADLKLPVSAAAAGLLVGGARSRVVTMSLVSLSWAFISSPEMALTSSTISFLFLFALWVSPLARVLAST